MTRLCQHSSLLFLYLLISFAAVGAAARTHYSVLGLSSTASTEDVRRAYKKLAKQYHPDKNQHDPRAKEKFVLVSAAHEVLSDPDKRRVYDDELSWGSSRRRPGRRSGEAYSNSQHARFHEQGNTYVYTMHGRRYYFTDPRFGSDENIRFSRSGRFAYQTSFSFRDLLSSILSWFLPMLIVIMLLCLLQCSERDTQRADETQENEQDDSMKEREDNGVKSTDAEQSQRQQPSSLLRKRRKAPVMTMITLHHSLADMPQLLEKLFPDVKFIAGFEDAAVTQGLLAILADLDDGPLPIDDTPVCVVLLKRATRVAVLGKHEFSKEGADERAVRLFLEKLLDGTKPTSIVDSNKQSELLEFLQ